MDEAPPDEAVGPCAGFRVLEFGTMVSGPLAAQNLGDLGADVIKVETLMGDTARWVGPPERDGALRMSTWTTSKVVQDFVRIPPGSVLSANQYPALSSVYFSAGA